MQSNKNTTRLAQSASALGAGLLGFGIGAIWGYMIAAYAIVLIIISAVFHIWGMYIMQMRNQSKSAEISARILWASAWICLIVLVAIIVYLLVTNKK